LTHGRVTFSSLRRQQFRKYFQPSRVLLGVIPAPTDSGVNVITLCFDMHCSYKPPMIAIAIQNVASSFELIQSAKEYVLAVPGEALVRETLFCGTCSLREVDKVQELGLRLIPSEAVSVPGLEDAIANLEMKKVREIKVGDHILVVGQVLRFSVNLQSRELPLLSIGPDTRGYRLSVKKGVHRIGTVSTETR
jgi:flavin reductase (DIM6/NTAB) family NADH-FMN oxidoreductase RutF